jgi:hypothetical protein
MTNKLWSTVLLLFTQLSLAQVATELVMHEGTSIDAIKDGSAIKVTAGKGFDRTYESDGCRLKSNMHARTTRWFGSLGIYDPAGSISGSLFSPAACKGITRTVVQEGQIHFDDAQFAYEWIRRQQRGYGKTGKTVWTNDGLLVSWNTVPGREQLNVDVLLMCINGKRPKNLEGATDSAIKIAANSAIRPIHECAVVGKDVIDKTRREMEEDWKKIDKWIAEDKERRERVKKPVSEK